MKLKYYMRGLGIGIILTTLILTLSHREMSDAEITRRAMEMGMRMPKDVFYDEVNGLDSSGGTPEGKDNNQGETSEDEVDNSEGTPEDEVDNSEGMPEDEANNSGETSGDQETSDDETSTDQADEENQDAEFPSNNSNDDNPAEGNTDSQTISFAINRGMSSNQISIMLKELGVIEDSADFNEYVLRQGKSEAIQIGEFEIYPNADYEEILKIITK